MSGSLRLRMPERAQGLARGLVDLAGSCSRAGVADEHCQEDRAHGKRREQHKRFAERHRQGGLVDGAHDQTRNDTLLRVEGGNTTGDEIGLQRAEQFGNRRTARSECRSHGAVVEERTFVEHRGEKC